MISCVPFNRWDADQASGATVGGRFGGFISDWAEFDANVFNVSPSEAAFMDPAQRVLLEVFSCFASYNLSYCDQLCSNIQNALLLCI